MSNSRWMPLTEFLNAIDDDFQDSRTYDLVRNFLRDYLYAEKKQCISSEIVKFKPERRTKERKKDKRQIIYYTTSEQRFLFPDARTLMKNIIFLLLFLDPRHVREVLLGQNQSNVLDEALNAAQSRARVYSAVWAARDALRARLVPHAADLRTIPLVTRARGRTGLDTTSAKEDRRGTTSVLGELLHLRHLDELANESPTARTAAETAFHHLQLGNVVLARNAAIAALKLDPGEPLAIAMKAFLLVAESHQARQHSDRMQFLADETGPDLGDSALAGLHLDSETAAGEAHERSREALSEFLRALAIWPKRETYFELPDVRAQVIRETLALAWAHRDFLARPEGASVRPELLDLVRLHQAEREKAFDFWRFKERRADDLLMLNLLHLLDVAAYVRVGADWKKKLLQSAAEQILPVLHRQDLAEHLNRLYGCEARAVLGRLRATVRSWAESQVAVAESRVAVEALRESFRAGLFEQALDPTTNLSELHLVGVPRLALVYGRLRAAHAILAEAVDARDFGRIKNLMAAHGEEITETVQRLASVDAREYLTEFDDDMGEYHDLLGMVPNLLPFDPGWPTDEPKRGDLALVLERILGERKRLGKRTASQCAALIAAISESQPRTREEA